MTDTPVRKSGKSSQHIVVLLVVIFLVIGGVSVLSQQYLGKSAVPGQPSDKLTITPPDVPAGSPTPSPTPVKIRQGKETYTFSWGQGTTIPMLDKLTVDPHDPKSGNSQTVQLEIHHTQPIDSITMEVQTDTKTALYPMKLTEGTNTKGVWVGTWTIDDTVLYKYFFTAKVTSGGKEQPYTVKIRG